MVAYRTRIGIDENGLGSRLGPLIVTSVDARVTEDTSRRLDHGHYAETGALLNDSKRLVSHHDTRIGEAWARALVGAHADSPEKLIEALTLYPLTDLQAPCPKHVKAQCWSVQGEAFSASRELVDAVHAQLKKLAEQGVAVDSVRSAIHCTKVLNQQLSTGNHRFLVDLHAMERLILDHHARGKQRILAVCGKVGGIADYAKFFGPLGGRLHVELERQKAQSVYEFPGLGEVRFVQDADAHDPLVMIASLVGKYVRELLMARITRHYSTDGSAASRPSGYHDSVTNKFVEGTVTLRAKRRIPIDCFERRRAE